MEERIRNRAFAAAVVEADEAAQLIEPGSIVGMSGFTGAGYPKEVPQALAKRISAEHEQGREMRISLWTGASTAPELDGALSEVDGVDLRMPYQSDPVTRERINTGRVDYADVHLSHVADNARRGSFGHLDTAIIEVSGITEDGRLIPSSSVGNNAAWLALAEKVILEVNSWQSEHLRGMHDVLDLSGAGRSRPVPIATPSDRVGEPALTCRPEKIAAVVRTHSPDRNSPFTPPDAVSQRIAEHVLDFLDGERRSGRLPRSLLPLQSGVGNVANAVLSGVDSGPFTGLAAYTEVIQDGMLQLLESGTLRTASATAFSLSPAAVDRFNREAAAYRDRIVLRPQEISNHPEVIRRLGCLAMNGAVEADIYGNVNSTHLMGSRVQNGIGGSGDFARNAALSVFVTPSQAKGGAISAIVPMVSHVDHTEHDVDVLVTEQGAADLRGLSPRARARLIIERCAHPDFRPALRDYLQRSLRSSYGLHTPHLLDEALSWHQRFVRTGSMRFG
ncbi:acetyl-CoA hydrolase/transferase family protein [Salinifilum ghardaiensis]